MKVIGYARRSVERGNGYGLDVQTDRIRAWADYRSAELLEVVTDDDVSGATPPDARPALGPALERLRTHEADALVIAKFDRLSRSLYDFAGLMRRAQSEGWAIVCLEPEIDLSTAMGRAFAQMLGVFAEFEREQIKDRLHAGRRAKAKDHGYVGGTTLARPFGYRLVEGADGKHDYEPDPLEQEVIRYVVERYARGEPLRAIAAYLGRRGTKTVLGGTTWQPSSVAAILRRAGVELRPRGRRKNAAA